MQITIEDNELIYIYLKEQRKYVSNIEGESSVKCLLLYDDHSNWIGIKVLNEHCDGEKFLLPPVGNVDFPTHSASIEQKDDCIIIFFNKLCSIGRVAEQDCHLDINIEGLYGIEIILWLTNRIDKKGIAKSFIIRDI